MILREAALAADVSDHEISTRLANGFLLRDAPGIYRIAGTPRTGNTAARAAVAAVSARAVGLWSANVFHGVHGGHVPTRVHLLVDWPRHYRATSWYKAHPTRRLEDDELTVRSGIPVTTMARSLRDFAAVLPRRPYDEGLMIRWTEEALIHKKLKLDDLEIVARREKDRSTRKWLLDLLEYERGVGDPDEFRSEAEEWIKDFVIRRSLPMPRFNAGVPGVGNVDAYWETPFIVEYESFKYHHTRSKHDRDQRRRRAGMRHGIPTVGITATDIRDDRTDLELDLESFILTGKGRFAT